MAKGTSFSWYRATVLLGVLSGIISAVISLYWVATRLSTADPWFYLGGLVAALCAIGLFGGAGFLFVMILLCSLHDIIMWLFPNKTGR